MELLSPAGSPDAVHAAVFGGADAVYLGYGDFNARRNAKNFSREELAAAVSYCHLHGVKVYLTLNTLLTDRELAAAAQAAISASSLGVDAVLVQDFGVIRTLRQCAPDLPVHASTQMTIHSLDGVKQCAELGMTRVVLSRELSRSDLAYICERSPIEIEVFVHGALCMCYSGQCYLSSLIGGRSGNRGLCAQPCRLPYGWNGKADSNPLSLKDLSLANHLQELEQMGVASVKIEGRMKRPEYVYIVTEVYARALREHRNPTPEDLIRLEAAFSRQGFTDAYFEGRTGPEMFGTRQEEKAPKEFYEAAQNAYRGKYAQRIPVKLYAMIQSGEPVQVAVKDEYGRVLTAAGDIPEPARNREITEAQIREQLSKTGGTPYLCKSAQALVEPGLSVPLSAINGLRRQVLDELSDQRITPPNRRHREFKVGARYANRPTPPQVNISLRTVRQLTPALLALQPAMVALPVHELAAHPEAAQFIMAQQIVPAVVLPRICGDGELPQLAADLERAWTIGARDAFIGNLGQLDLVRQLGFVIRGGFGLPAFNTQAMKEFKRLQFESVTASVELKLAQIRDLSKAVNLEMIVYGRLPLMITENCILKNRTGQCDCTEGPIRHLTDRKGIKFPVLPAPGCRNELFNSATLFLADRAGDYEKLGLWAVCLSFTTESARHCVTIADRYIRGGNYMPENYTRGLYYRDVE